MRNFLFPLGFFIFVTSIFFYKTIFYGQISLPADSLVAEYEPYRSYSVSGFSPGAVPHKAQGPDVIRMLFPWKVFAVEQLSQKELPLWNPYSFSGKPHMAGLQAGTFYPLNVLFLSGTLFGWSLFIMLQPILAGCFTYLFLREIKLAKSSSLFGGFVFAFSSYMVVWLEYGNLGNAFLWLPLALWAIIRFIRSKSVWALLTMIASLAFSLLAGYIQLSFYVYAVTISFIFFNWYRERKKQSAWKKYGLLLIGCVASLLLVSFQLIPMAELFSFSARTPYTFQQLSDRLINPMHAIGIFFPDIFGNPASRSYWFLGTYIEKVLYVGIIPIMFLLFSWFTKKSYYTVFFFAVALVSFISTLDIYPIKLFHSLGIPLLSTTVPSRVICVYSFAVSALCAIGFDYWSKKNYESRFFKRAFFVAAVALGSFIFVSILLASGQFIEYREKLFIAQRNMILPTIISVAGAGFFFAGKFFPRQVIIAFLFFLTIVDLFYFFQKITPFSPREFLYPPTPVTTKLKEIQGIDRSWGYGSAYIDTNLHTYEKLFGTDGYDSLFIKRYGEFIAASKDGNIPKDIPRSDVAITPGFGGEDLAVNQYRKRILDIAGVKYILNKKGHPFPKDGYDLVWQDEVLEIYKNKSVLPRVFLASDYIVQTKRESIIKQLLDLRFDPHKTLILEEKPPFSAQKNILQKEVDVVSYTPNTVVLEADAKDNGLLFLSDNYFPGWKVRIDGKDATIYRANYAFRAVPIEQGKHTVIFSYEPHSFKIGLYVSITTAVFIVFFTLFIKRHEIFKIS